MRNHGALWLRCVAAMTLLCFLVPEASTGSIPSAPAVLSEIHTRGATAVLNEICGTPKWDQILTKIETGQSGWLDVAIALHPATDGGASEMLALAAGEALLHNPREVLMRVASVLGIEGVCSGPDIDDPRYAIQQKAVSTLDARILAVARLKDRKLSDLRDSCLKLLRSEKALLLSADGPYR